MKLKVVSQCCTSSVDHLYGPALRGFEVYMSIAAKLLVVVLIATFINTGYALYHLVM